MSGHRRSRRTPKREQYEYAGDELLLSEERPIPNHVTFAPVVVRNQSGGCFSGVGSGIKRATKSGWTKVRSLVDDDYAQRAKLRREAKETLKAAPRVLMEMETKIARTQGQLEDVEEKMRNASQTKAQMLAAIKQLYDNGISPETIKSRAALAFQTIRRCDVVLQRSGADKRGLESQLTAFQSTRQGIEATVDRARQHDESLTTDFELLSTAAQTFGVDAADNLFEAIGDIAVAGVEGNAVAGANAGEIVERIDDTYNMYQGDDAVTEGDFMDSILAGIAGDSLNIGAPPTSDSTPLSLDELLGLAPPVGDPFSSASSSSVRNPVGVRMPRREAEA
jgi:hypothetical protein